MTGRLVAYACGLVLLAAGSGLGMRFAWEHARGARGAAQGAAAGLAAGPLAGALGAPEPEPPRVASPRELAKLQESWVGSETIAPRTERVDAATGERLLPFHGFGVEVETAPAGARVLVDGEELGTAPLVATVRCRPGAEVQVRAERAGAAATARTRCREDALVRLSLQLRAAR